MAQRCHEIARRLQQLVHAHQWQDWIRSMQRHGLRRGVCSFQVVCFQSYFVRLPDDLARGTYAQMH